eukprot:549874-Rhodomonas_salina.1
MDDWLELLVAHCACPICVKPFAPDQRAVELWAPFMAKSRKAYKPLALMCYRWDVDHAHHRDLKEMKSMLLEGQRKG